MDRPKKLDKQALYEIYRACRLCGAAGGYKMPIIQNLIKLEGEVVQLHEKIRECLQIEVNSNDKMPPLICETCVDKLNEFYDFLKTCQQTNTNTRKRLGLPLQVTAPAKVTPAPAKVLPPPVKVTPPKKVISKDIGTDTCMLGLIEASAVKQDIYIVGMDTKSKNSKVKKEETKRESSVKPETPIHKSPTLKDIKQKEKDNKRKRDPSPKRTTRQNNSIEELVNTKIQDAPITPPLLRPKPGPKSKRIEKNDTNEEPNHTRAKEKQDLSKKVKEIEDPKSKGKKERDDEPLNKLKRAKEKDNTDLMPPAKKAKTSEPIKPPQPKPQKNSKPSPKTIQPTPASKKVQPEGIPCVACPSILKTSAGFKNHMHYVHPVTWTPDNLACNACRDWFPTIEESIAHHKKHAYYRCLRCKKKYKNGVLYHQHIENNRCLPDEVVPDVKCIECERTFPTNNLLKEHRCQGQDGRPGGKCSKCNRNYALLKNLMKHESTCMFRKKVDTQPVIDPDVERRLLPMEVRITKCDSLLEYGPVVSACTVPHRFGLDRKMSYPYMPKLRVIKKPTFNFKPLLVSVQDDTKDDYSTDEFNWVDFEDIELKTVKKLSTLALKVIFSDKMFGDKEILDEIEISRRTALKKRINSIIFRFDEESSPKSDSILDKNVVTTSFDIANDDFFTKITNNSNNSTVFEENNDKSNFLAPKNDDVDKTVNIFNDSNISDTSNRNRNDDKLNIKDTGNTDVMSLSTEKLETLNTLGVNETTDKVNEYDILLSNDMRFDKNKANYDNLSLIIDNSEKIDDSTHILDENQKNQLKNDENVIGSNKNDQFNTNTDILAKNLNNSYKKDDGLARNDENDIVCSKKHDNSSKIENDENSAENDINSNSNVASDSEITENSKPPTNTVHFSNSIDSKNRNKDIESIETSIMNIDNNECIKVDDNPKNDTESHDHIISNTLDSNNLYLIYDNDLPNNKIEGMEMSTEKLDANNLNLKHDNDIIIASEEKMEIDTNTGGNILDNEVSMTKPQSNLELPYNKTKDVEDMEIEETDNVNRIQNETNTKIDQTESVAIINDDKTPKSDNESTIDSKITINKDQPLNSNINNPDINNIKPKLHNILENNTITTQSKTSPQKSKTLDFSVTSILNHVTSKNLDISSNIAEKEDTDNKNMGSIENAAFNTLDTNPQITSNDGDSNDNKNDKNDSKDDSIRIDSEFAADNHVSEHNSETALKNDDEVSLNSDINSEFAAKNHDSEHNSETALKNDDVVSLNTDLNSELTAKNHDLEHNSETALKNDDVVSLNSDLNSEFAAKTDDTSTNSVSATFTDKNEDTISLNSLKYLENTVTSSDKFNVNDLSEDERKLMEELDEQIGETNDKIDKLNDNKDMNIENLGDGYSFD